MAVTIERRRYWADKARAHLLAAELAEWRPGVPWPIKVASDLRDAARCCREAGLDPDRICRGAEDDPIEADSRLRRALWKARL